MKLMGFVWTGCPHCNRVFAFRDTPKSRSRVYVRMFTHMRLNHWTDYLERAKAEIAKLNGLIG